jgi:copper chaperone CopZ
LERLPGVKRADVRLETGQARIVYDEAKQTPENLSAAIDKLGFQASVLGVTAAPKATLYVEGVRDAAAARKVERALKAVKGVKDVSVDRKAGEVFVDYDGQTAKTGDLVAAAQAAGFKARPAPP